MKIAVIGGGAAGFFAAINCAAEDARNEVAIFEKSGKLLSKVRVSGGGRCNVTHACFDNKLLTGFYPRGNKELQSAFSRFSTSDTVRWFESRQVRLKTEADGRMFPVTDRSETVIQCLLQEAEKHRVAIHLNRALQRVLKKEDGHFDLFFQNGEQVVCDKVVITTGGSPALSGYDWNTGLGHTLQPPVPSLFTFNIPGSPLKGLEGISSPLVRVKLAGFNYESSGPLLITHWGISGPAVLRMSAFAARWLFEKNYSATCIINWIPDRSEEEVRSELIALRKESPNKKISLIAFHGISSRLWQRLCSISQIGDEERCGQLTNVGLNKLVRNCCHLELQVMGKTTFKEEFVTCGGVSLKEVNMQTLESRKVKGLYFAGEVLDIDGVTGGFNFQSAWTTGYLAGVNASKGSE